MERFPWVALLLLGAWHGVNPGMGWLFAVALGLQERQGRAVWRALPPLAAGHALAVAQAVVVTAVLGLIVPLAVLKWVVAAVLGGYGVYRLVRSRHPRFGGMKASTGDLVLWSMLMASAHGAGLMVVPFTMGLGASGGHATHGMAHGGMSAGVAGLWATLAHTGGYLLVTGVVAVLVYQRLGLRMLRTWWLNLDIVWAVALIATAALTVVL